MQKILLVNNDASFTDIISFSLCKEGDYQLSIAKNGKEAAAAVARSHFDLVITDMFMPYSNGHELIAKIRKSKSQADTQVMVLSDVSNEKSIAHCFRLGADMYLQKPLNAFSLLAEIRNMLANHANVAA